MFKTALADTPSSLAEAGQILEQIRQENPKHWPHGLTVGHFDGGLYLVRDKQASTAVGFVGWQERQEGLTKVGYYAIGILPEHRQQGFARDAVATMLAKKASQVDQVRAAIVEGNTPSVRLADGLGVSRKMLKRADRSDKGGWAGVGGAALLGDTAYNLHQGGRVGQQLIDLHRKVLEQPQALLDPETASNTLREYGQAANRGSKLRILGLPMGKWFQYAPPSALSAGAGAARARPSDMLRYHFNPSSLTPETRQNIHQSVNHYKGYLNHPEQAQLMELTTGHSFGNPRDVRPEFKALGIDRNFLSNLAHNEVSDPLKFLNQRALEVGGLEGKSKLGRLYYDDLKRLFTGDAPANSLHNFGALQRAKAYMQGSAAYGAGGLFASKFSKLTALAAALSGAYGVHRLAKDKPSFFKRSSSVRPDTELTGGAGAMAGGGYLLNRARQYAPSNLLVSTAGQLAPPFAVTDTGAGHTAPARAIYEALAGHPAVQSGEFQADLALRTMNKTKTDEWMRNMKSPAEYSINPKAWFDRSWLNPFKLDRGSNPFMNHGQNHALMTVDSGFGAHMDTGMFGLRSPEFTSNPAGRVLFVPDPVGGSLGVDKRFFFGTHQPKTRPGSAITFGGPKTPASNAATFNNLEHFDYHPALSEGVLTAAKQHLAKPEPAASILGDLVTRLRTSGDTASATQLEQAMASGRHLIGVSGSSRGDLVASRAAELQQLLKTKGLQDKFQVVAMLANAKGNAGDPTSQLLKDFPEVLQLGHTGKLYGADKGPESMYKLLNSMKYHWGSTGASAQGEAGLMSVPTGFVTRYEEGKQRMFDAFKQRGIELPEGPRRVLDQVKLDQWNAPAIKDIVGRLHGKGVGMDAVNTADDLLPHLEKLLKDPNSLDMSARAKVNLERAVANKRGLADVIVEEARKLRRTTGGMMMRRGLAGAGLVGLGAAGVGHALSRRDDPSERLRRSYEKFKERFQ